MRRAPYKAGSAYGMFIFEVKLDYIITTQEVTELIDFPFKLKTSMAMNDLDLIHSYAAFPLIKYAIDRIAQFELKTIYNSPWRQRGNCNNTR